MTTLTFQEKRKKGHLALVALVVIVFLIFMVLHYGFPKKEEKGGSFIQLPQSSYLEEIEINFDTFKNPFFESALPFEKIKPFEGQIGRENPFAPYSPFLLSPATGATPTSTF